MSLNDYKLSAELLGHSLDVRAVATSEKYIVSGSRDKTAKIWEYNGTSYAERFTLLNHKNYVSAVCVLDGGEWICTGSNDSTICVYVAGNVEPFCTLRGHSSTVSTLAPGNVNNVLLSGSWDKTAIVWKITGFEEQNSIKLEGHEAAVWCICALKSGKFVTGSADKSIIYWNSSGEKLKILKGHKDCVRALLSLPNDSIISASNDATIKFWNEDGECVKELYGHTNYIYSLAFNYHLGENTFISGGEDCTLRMWNFDGELGNPITLPAQSVWSVACLKNGDIVTGTSDGIVRIFTKDSSRFADEQTQATFNSSVEIRIRETNLSLGGVKVNELPGPEALLQKGRDGQTKMIRHPDGKIICYEWSNGKWNSLGDVVGAAGGTQDTSGKTLFEGKEYDYVFTVDISDNAPPLKLPYNRGEDPWTVAQSFIHKNELPQAYLDQVANFIIKNSENAPIIDTVVNSSFQDPFTGEGRYIPGMGSNFGAESGNVDPFTGGSSYSAQNTPSVPVNFVPRSGQNYNPFTGSSSHSTASSTNKHFPYNQYTTIVICDSSKVLSKLREFNQLVDTSVKADDIELENAKKLTTGEDSSIDSINTMKKLLSWPKDYLFPVLDILRMGVCSPNVCTKLITQETLNLIVQNISVPPANQLMSIRILLNMLSHGYGRGLVETCLTNILVAISTIKNGSSNLQVAISTLLLNFTIVHINHADETQCQHITESIIDFLLWNSDPESLYRAYRAIGNLLCTPYAATISAQLISTDQVMENLRNNMSSQQQAGHEKINEISREIVNAL